MTEQQKKFISITVWVFAFCLIARFIIGWQEVVPNKPHILSLAHLAIGFIGEAISVTGAFMAFLRKKLGVGRSFLISIMFLFYILII
ncbi:hypothetical protein [Streptococcus intermedius]|uniref:hypothetical protein n=1 Tax=Streptococcus intermedius TaxID=1338 RepID=UPI000B315FA0|nr:hypothetical protein [Streptococcus intermedius]